MQCLCGGVGMCLLFCFALVVLALCFAMARQPAGSGRLLLWRCPPVVVSGLTLGLRQLCLARHCVLLVTGTHKAAVLQQAMTSGVTAAVPVSLLRRYSCGEVRVICDRDAAAQRPPLPP